MRARQSDGTSMIAFTVQRSVSSPNPRPTPKSITEFRRQPNRVLGRDLANVVRPAAPVGRCVQVKFQVKLPDRVDAVVVDLDLVLQVRVHRNGDAAQRDAGPATQGRANPTDRRSKQMGLPVFLLDPLDRLAKLLRVLGVTDLRRKTLHERIEVCDSTGELLVDQ